MRLTAAGLLVAMLFAGIAARLGEGRFPVLAFLRAFAEAAIVGGLADWFAVTALFRRPLGLPIPHTAVVARNKDRIGDAVGNFVANNFLSPEVLLPKIRAPWILPADCRAGCRAKKTPGSPPGAWSRRFRR